MGEERGTGRAGVPRSSLVSLPGLGQAGLELVRLTTSLAPTPHFLNREAESGVWLLSPRRFLVTSCTEAITAPLWSPQTPRPGQGHLHCSARPGSHTPSPCFPFFCRAQGTPPHLPANTVAAGHSPLCLGRVLLLLVSSLLTHSAFQRAELSHWLAIKASRAPSALTGGFSSFLEEPSQCRSTHLRVPLAFAQ